MKNTTLKLVNPEIAYRLFYPQVPVIVTAMSGTATASMPANSCIPVSNSPPLICVAIRRKGRTGKIIESSGAFSLNWVGYEDHFFVENLARSIESKNKLEQLGISYEKVRGAPVLTDSYAYVVCKLLKKISVGDHNLFIARIISARASRDFHEYWGYKNYRPVLYLGSDKKKQFTSI
ncbi:MAG: flavin reductase family protein [Nitrososphaerales archaeon]